jgi:hypothetical protein
MKSILEFCFVLVGVYLVFVATKIRNKQPKIMVCMRCCNIGIPKIETHGSILIEIILWLCFFIPGLIYSIWRRSSRKKICPNCGSTELVPPDSPVGKKLIREFSQGESQSVVAQK